MNIPAAVNDAEVYLASRTKRRRATRAEVEASIEIIIDGRPMTVRQVFYQATVRGIVPKTENGYNMVQDDEWNNPESLLIKRQSQTGRPQRQPMPPPHRRWPDSWHDPDHRVHTPTARVANRNARTIDLTRPIPSPQRPQKPETLMPAPNTVTARGATKAVVLVDPIDVLGLAVPDGKPRCVLRIALPDGGAVSADVAAKSVRRCQVAIREYGPDGVASMVQGKLAGAQIVDAGIAAQPKTKKSEPAQTVAA